MARTKTVPTRPGGQKRPRVLKVAADVAKVKRPHRFRAGTQTMRLMRRLQSKLALTPVVPLACIERAIRKSLSGSGVERVGKGVAQYIRNIVEAVSVSVLSDALDRADDGRGVTLRKWHMQRAMRKWLVTNRML